MQAQPPTAAALMQAQRAAVGSLSAAGRTQGRVVGLHRSPHRRVSTRFRPSEQDADAADAAAQPARPLPPQQQQAQHAASSSSPFKNRQLGHGRFSRGSPHLCASATLFYERPDDEELVQGWRDWWAAHVLTWQPWLAPRLELGLQPTAAAAAAAPGGSGGSSSSSSNGSGASRLLASAAHALGQAGPDPPPLRRLLVLLAGVAAGLAGAALLAQAARLLVGLLLAAYAGLPTVV